MMIRVPSAVSGPFMTKLCCVGVGGRRSMMLRSISVEWLVCLPLRRGTTSDDQSRAVKKQAKYEIKEIVEIVKTHFFGTLG